jgi:putative transposase
VKPERGTDRRAARKARDFSRGSRAVGAANCRCGSGCSGVMRYRSTRKSVYSAKYHVIWCPKYRQRVIGGRVEARLKQIIDEVVTECGGDVIECETMPDHVHLLLELPPTVPLSALMQKPKGRSSRRLWAEFPQLRRLPALWSPSWFVSTAGGAPLDVARRYVENQQLLTSSTA